MAVALGAVLRPVMPEALDLSARGARGRLADWLAQGDNGDGFR
jgi:hypothetical protein